MICKRCFRMSDDGYKYCPYCGKSFTDDSDIEIKERCQDTDTPRNAGGAPAAPEADPLGRPDSVPQGHQQYRGYTMPPPTMPPYPFYAPIPREKSAAGKFFSAIGHAALYVLLFFACQLIVSLIYTGAVYPSIQETFFAETGYSQIDLLKDPDVYAEFANYLNATIQSTGGYSIIGIASAVLAVIALLIIAKTKSRPFSEHTGFFPVRTWKVLLLLPLGVAANYLVLLIIGLIPWPEWAISELESTYSYIGEGSTPFIYMLNLFASVIAAPIVEEMIFRGCVYTRLRRGMPTAAAMILSAFCFGLVHGIAIAVFYATLLGLMLAYSYNKFDSILAPMLLHIGFNLTNYLPFMPEETEGAEMRIIVVLVVSAVVFTVCSAVIIFSDVSRKKPADRGDMNFPDHPNYPNI